MSVLDYSINQKEKIEWRKSTPEYKWNLSWCKLNQLGMYRTFLVVCCLYLALTEEVRMTLVLHDCQKARLLARSSAGVLINAKCKAHESDLQNVWNTFKSACHSFSFSYGFRASGYAQSTSSSFSWTFKILKNMCIKLKTLLLNHQ